MLLPMAETKARDPTGAPRRFFRFAMRIGLGASPTAQSLGPVFLGTGIDR